MYKSLVYWNIYFYKLQSGQFSPKSYWKSILISILQVLVLEKIKQFFVPGLHKIWCCTIWRTNARSILLRRACCSGVKGHGLVVCVSERKWVCTTLYLHGESLEVDSVLWSSLVLFAPVESNFMKLILVIARQRTPGNHWHWQRKQDSAGQTHTGRTVQISPSKSESERKGPFLES